MNRRQLEHAIRAACDVADDDELYVFGSQAILGEYPDAPAALRRSVEVDVAPKNKPENVDRVDGALGELSQFHRTHGFYVHGVSIETAALPEGWRERALPVRNENTGLNTGWCLEGPDLAASKLVAFRSKDRRFVERLLSEGMVDADVLVDRIAAIVELDDEGRDRLRRWVLRTRDELRGRKPGAEEG